MKSSAGLFTKPKLTNLIHKLTALICEDALWCTKPVKKVYDCYVQVCSMFCSAPGAPPSAPPPLRYLAPAVAYKAWEALLAPSLARASSTVPIHQSV
jgi:hypothetical protein